MKPAGESQSTAAVVRPWDTPGLPPATEAQRCANHRGMCAYRDDDPTCCPRCHRTWTQIAAEIHSGQRDDHGCEAKYGKALRRTQGAYDTDDTDLAGVWVVA